MPIGEVFISASIQVLFEKLASHAISELGKLYGVKDEVAKLQGTLNRLQAMLRHAEQKKMAGESFTLWLQELKMAACEAEDVVDEFEYEDLRRKVKNSPEARSGAYCKSLLSTSRKLGKFCSCLNPREVSFRCKMARRIDDIRRKLDEISKDKKDLDVGGALDAEVNQQLEFKGQMKETTSLLADPEVFGRDEVNKKLMGLLLLATTDVRSATSSSSSSSLVQPTSFSLLSIVGMGGLGKTTLAKLIYNTKEVQNHFPLRMWVFVSVDFDLKRLTKQILEHVDPQSGLQNIDNLNVLQQSLSERLKGKRFLLVLDDVWVEDHSKWREFSAPLTQGAEGSKVLITTRIKNVADLVRSVKIELEDLSFEDCWMIFKKHAFPYTNSDDHPNLVSIGKKIVARLKGVPLAATTIGSLLGSELEERKWRNVLQSELWELKQGEEGIIPALRVSYEYLPPHLKQCFAYCAVFPKGHSFDMLELVQLWIAQGYVRPQGKKLMEDVGIDYLNELLNRSLIQFVHDKYVIHDLLHDLGQLILQHDFYQIGPDQMKEIPEDAYSKLHLRLDYEESLRGELDVLYNFRSLRTLLFWFSGFRYIEVPPNLFHRVDCLRVLDLSFSSLYTLPESIGCLKHLRYIDLRETKIKCLPDSLCALYKLQTLKLGGCDELNILPSGMSNLISLHYLQAKHQLVSKIPKIGKLTHLQNLEVFSISEENANKLGDLKNMNKLRGKLCIQNLQGVETGEEAIEAALKNMQYLEILEMEWADDRNDSQLNNHLEESIIEGLEPPPQLKELTVKSYAGVKFPSWMNNNSIPSLESIHLHRCINLSPLPPVGQLQFLKTLNITRCPKLNELPPLPTTLRSLILRDVRLHALPNSLHHLPLLRIVICLVPNLRKLPLLPTTLKELTVEGVGLETLPEFCQEYELSATTSGAGGECESNDERKPALSILKIHGWPHLTTLHEGLLKHHLRHLQVLSIKDCTEVVDWPEGEGFRATLRSLGEEFSIERCPKLRALPEGIELRPSVKKLIVKASPGVPNTSLFSQVHKFDSDDVFVENWYRNLAHCADEALRHILAVDWLNIKYLQEDNDGMGTTAADWEECPPSSSPPVSFVYDREETFGWERKGNYMSRHVSIEIKGRRRRGRQGVDVDDGATVDDDSSKLLCTCLGGYAWTSSLRKLILHRIPGRAFIGVQHIRHRECGSGEDEAEGGEGGDDGALPHHSLPPLPQLRYLSTDDARLLTRLLVNHSHHGQNSSSDGNGCFFRSHLLTSFRFLSIIDSELTCLAAKEEEALMSLGSSLQCLFIGDGPNLQNLPADLRSLLPNLKVLSIENCPKIRGLPDRGLPASLELLNIEGCPALAERCRPQQYVTRRGAGEDGDWHKMAHVPVIQIDDLLLRGSFGRFLELKAKWDFFC